MLIDAAPLRRAASNPANPSSRDYPRQGKQIGSQNAILPIAWWLRRIAGLAAKINAYGLAGLRAARPGQREWLSFQYLKRQAYALGGDAASPTQRLCPSS
jgi:hypothetical protein